MSEVPKFLNESMRAMKAVSNEGWQIHSYDIEGCFPNMPKKAIKEAMREVRDALAENRYKGIWVPTADSLSCQWTQPKNRKKIGTWIPWEILTEVLEFALDNAFIKMPNGKFYWQKDGIPMGDPLSPAMTNI